MRVETRRLVRIAGAHEWYKDPDFVEWINSNKTATWHISGNDPDEGSDVFTSVDGKEGSDEPGYGDPAPPEWIWEQITWLVAHFTRHYENHDALVWISNEGAEDVDLIRKGMTHDEFMQVALGDPAFSVEAMGAVRRGDAS